MPTAANGHHHQQQPAPSTVATNVPEQPEVPNVIYDPHHQKTYNRGRFMGRGGFARCYEVIDQANGATFACKIVAKAILQKQHHREKMAQEIEIHRGLKHPYVVQFYAYFEDHEFIYIILELCSNRSLMEMQKRRKQLTEPEARYFVRQIIGACQYLRSRLIVHRDLKLGNLFLSDAMDIKLGDFGLAAKLDHGDARRNTLCGTPNYIAPEILDRKGHGFEADVWSLGCILYTLIVGRPPFETSNLKATYDRIKKGEYTIPTRTSKPAADFIHACLKSQPHDRPSMTDLLKLDFFRPEYFTPHALPTSCLTMQPRFADHQAAPTYSQLSTAAASAGVAQQKAALYTAAEPVNHQQQLAAINNNQHRPRQMQQPQQQYAPSAASSQQQPLTVPNKHSLKTVTSFPSVPSKSLAPRNEDDGTAKHNVQQPQQQPLSRPPIRNAAQNKVELNPTAAGTDTTMPSTIKPVASITLTGSSVTVTAAAPVPEAASGTGATNNDAGAAEMNSVPQDYWLSSLRDLLARVYCGTKDAEEVHAPACYDAAEDPSLAPMIWISKWVDYSDKYGLGYQLIDNSVGVLFNDATKLLLLEEGDQMQYVDRNANESYISINQVDHCASDVKKKITLLRYFHNYMRDNLLRAGEDLLPTKQTNRMARLPWMRTWFRSRNAINMHLTNGTLQINFFKDHQKIILCPLMNAITVISSTTKDLHTFSLDKFLEMQHMPAALRKQVEYAVGICGKLLCHRVSGSCRLRLPDNCEDKSPQHHPRSDSATDQNRHQQQQQQIPNVMQRQSSTLQRHLSAEQQPSLTRIDSASSTMTTLRDGGGDNASTVEMQD